MNDLLNKAEGWFASLEIQTKACATCLMVKRNDLLKYGDGDPQATFQLMIHELRNTMGTNKFYWRETGHEWLYLDTF